MKKLLSILAAVVLLLPAAALADDVGVGIGVIMETEDFAPLIWMCDHRFVFDDAVEGGRFTGDGDIMWERISNYAFEGEQIMWIVTVMDKNGIEKIEDVFATVGLVQGIGNDIEVNCDLKSEGISEDLYGSCNARIDEEILTYEDYEAALGDTMASYVCTFTVETPDSMYGEYWVTVEVTDLDGLSNIMDENEYWYFNPVIALSIEGELNFGTVRPGTLSYSETILVENDCDLGSGVTLDMFISGTDFYDSTSSGAKCPTTNQLSLEQFDYYATQGAYSTQFDSRNDAEGYVGIGYGDHFDSTFYDDNEIIQTLIGFYSPGNILTPGAEIAMTFRLDLPEPCNGDFDSGAIYFWGEAI